MLNFALMGCGRISGRHIDLLSKNQIRDAHLSAVCDIVPEKARLAGEKADIPYYLNCDEMLKKHPEIVIDLIFWDYSTKKVSFPIKHGMGYVSYSLLDEEYEKTGGILTYKVDIVAGGKVYQEWKHQLWINLITIDDNDG